MQLVVKQQRSGCATNMGHSLGGPVITWVRGRFWFGPLEVLQMARTQSMVRTGNPSLPTDCKGDALETMAKRHRQGLGTSAPLPVLCELMISNWIDRGGPALCTTSWCCPPTPRKVFWEQASWNERPQVGWQPEKPFSFKPAVRSSLSLTSSLHRGRKPASFFLIENQNKTC